jgi:ABC-type uncharacterized transport system substrate-binding protein
MASHIGRRKFLATLSGAAAAWPLAARAQQPERMRRIAVLTVLAESDPEAKTWIAALEQRLQQLGWRQGRNLRIDYRWGSGDERRLQTYAAELVGAAPDVLFCAGTSALMALSRETRSLPIVFVQIADPAHLVKRMPPLVRECHRARYIRDQANSLSVQTRHQAYEAPECEAPECEAPECHVVLPKIFVVSLH